MNDELIDCMCGPYAAVLHQNRELQAQHKHLQEAINREVHRRREVEQHLKKEFEAHCDTKQQLREAREQAEAATRNLKAARKRLQQARDDRDQFMDAAAERALELYRLREAVQRSHEMEGST